MPNAPVRIGLVGCGRQASAAWYPNFATIPQLDLAAFALYILDLELGTGQALLRNGENQLTVRLVPGQEEVKGTVVIEELEVYIYVRGVSIEQ